MKWIKASEKIIETFEKITPNLSVVEKRKMFGYFNPEFFVVLLANYQTWIKPSF